ncbi:MAG: UbiX family flavin prenyltransferase [Thermoplasmata archaeon]|nr:UbiX family flavin prenyltransferase [Thermoplasmata archaeon]
MVPLKGSGRRSVQEQGPVIVGVTGASGAPIAVRLLDALAMAGRAVALVVSDGGAAVLHEECGLSVTDLGRKATVTYSDRDLSAPIASGSRRNLGMVVVPCSANSAAKVALGLADTLITRAAHVQIKEKRRLVIVPRETPLSAIQLRHLADLAALGVVVLDAAPPYYTHPKSVDDQVAFLAGKILDQLDVPHQLYRGWRAGEG